MQNLTARTLQFALRNEEGTAMRQRLVETRRLQCATVELFHLAPCPAGNLRNRMNTECGTLRMLGTTVAIRVTEMSSPHLSQRNGRAVREHRNSDGQDGRCAAGVYPFAKATGRCSTGPSLFLWPW